MKKYRDQIIVAIDKALNQFNDEVIDKFCYSSTPDHVETVVNHAVIEMLAILERNTYADKLIKT